MNEIHPTSIIENGAEIGEDAKIGPFCCIGPNVKIGARVELKSHVVLGGRTEIGDDCKVFPFASIGLQPQDLKFGGEKSTLSIGDRNIVREYVTMNPGTEGGGLATEIGNDNLFMVGAHVAHDCTVGSNVVMANNATLAGHVIVEDYAIIGGLAAIHQFCRIGRHAMVGGMSGVENDIIPYGSVMGGRAWLSGLNLIGLKRRGFSKDEIQSLRVAYRQLFADEGLLSERIEDVADQFPDVDAVREIVEFMRAESQRGLTQPKSANG
ncbi:MAG: acyl-ACP--UDP-N-acetylglucosamine O-acyltransferase [Candidatus Latescibacterota bacterium]|nr:acyl-[acyl-carrier-protein]--UDP-N-acetylglucosamine O-acyltransferase [Rhodospirillaceae bacterium]